MALLVFPATSRLSCPWAAEIRAAPAFQEGGAAVWPEQKAPGSVGVRHIGGRSGFSHVGHLYEIKRSCIYGVVVIPENRLPDDVCAPGCW